MGTEYPAIKGFVPSSADVWTFITSADFVRDVQGVGRREEG